MTYTEAVQLALDGNDRGFGFLYQNTYKEKLYLALQYMKNQSDAEDVLQDAYVKAFSNLKDLKDPEKFSSWLGQIVANTAKNALVKKNPVLFTDLPADEEEEASYEERIPDEDVSTQPELSYTREETRQMVQEMIDSLSDEQRVCILMYHMEDMPIKEIAETLDCSESTVKSRLNYGRKNLKAKAEEMQKKGYKLYSLAPLALFTLLLHTDEQAAYTDPSFTAAGRQISTNVLDEIHAMPQGGISGADEAGAAAEEAAESGEEAAEGAVETGEEAAGGAGEAGGTEAEAAGETAESGEFAKTGENAAETAEEATGETVGSGTATATQAGGTASQADASGTALGSGARGTSGAGGPGAGGTSGAGGSGAAAGGGAGAGTSAGAKAGAGFLGTTAGKAIAIVAAVAVAGGAAFGISRLVQNNNDDEVLTAQEETVDEISGEKAEEKIQAESDEEIAITEEMYPDLLEGGLTKSQFEVLLGYVSAPMRDWTVTDKDVAELLTAVTADLINKIDATSQEYIGVEGSYRPIVSNVSIMGYYDYNLAEMNNFLSVLIPGPISESDLEQEYYQDKLEIDGNTLSVCMYGWDLGTPRHATTITDAIQSGDTITLNYTVTLLYSYSGSNESEDLCAVLKQTEDGKYRIESVSERAEDDAEENLEQEKVASLKSLYEQVLQYAVEDRLAYADDSYEFDAGWPEIEGYWYFMTDMDNDGVPELIVGKEYFNGGDSFYKLLDWWDCHVFSAEFKDGEWGVKEINGEIDLVGATIPADGNGFIAATQYHPDIVDYDYNRITIENDTLIVGNSSGPGETEVYWCSANDLTGFDMIDEMMDQE